MTSTPNSKKSFFSGPRIAYAGILFFWLIILAGFDYWLPEKTSVYITGGEVKRVDRDGPIGAENPADGPTHDAYFIYSSLDSPTSGLSTHVRVFRNEDTGWHWPFYFKFDSADLQAKSLALADKKSEVTITSYGWRFNIFSMFPNVLDVDKAEDALIPFSILRLLGMMVWVLLVIKSFLICRRLLNKGASHA